MDSLSIQLDEQQFQSFMKSLEEGKPVITESDQSYQEVMNIGGFHKSDDRRKILTKEETDKKVGFLLTTFQEKIANGILFKKQVCTGTAFLVQIKENKYIVSAGHNLVRKLNIGSKHDDLQYAEKIEIILGKYQEENEVILNDAGVLKLNLDPKDVFIPPKYKHNAPDGCDIALIKVQRQSNSEINQYLQNQQGICFNIFENHQLLFDNLDEGMINLEQPSDSINNQGSNLSSRFVDIFSLKSKNQNEESIKFILKMKNNQMYLIVCGYPGEMKNIYYPQVMMGEKIDISQWLERFKEAKKKHLLIYTNIQTSLGQSGSPVILKIGNELFVVGVHIGGKEKYYNLATYFQDFQGLRELFKEDSFFNPYKNFDAYLKNENFQQHGQINQ